MSTYDYEPFECIWWEQYTKDESESDTSNQHVNK